jgi:hypothetical protein
MGLPSGQTPNISSRANEITCLVEPTGPLVCVVWAARAKCLDLEVTHTVSLEQLFGPFLVKTCDPSDSLGAETRTPNLATRSSR